LIGIGLAADADKHRHAPGDDRERALDERLALIIIEGRAFAGGAQREDAADPGGDVMLDQLVVADEIDGALVKRRHDRQPDAR
jgi:hypothetical protein